MNYREALAYIREAAKKGSRPGLSRIEELLFKMGSPQNETPIIHVAGTNGKGSFSAMTSSVLCAAGYKTGLFSSPYLDDIKESIRIDGENISEEDFAFVCSSVASASENMSDKPTEFEILTAAAYEYFCMKNCDVAIVECGMGGRLDATNVMTPILSVITGISLDHATFLGNTVEEIASEKAGIIKPFTPILWCGEDILADRVICEAAESVGAPIYRADREILRVKEMSLDGTVFDFGETNDIRLPLLGEYQLSNARNTLSALGILCERGHVAIAPDAIRKGFSSVEWRGRFELLSKSPVVISDGGHNPEGIDAAVSSMKKYFGEDCRAVIVTGVMADKDVDYISSTLSEIAEKVNCITPDNPRALSAEKYAEIFTENGTVAEPYANCFDALGDAIEAAREKNIPVLSVGSLYMYREIYSAAKRLLPFDMIK